MHVGRIERAHQLHLQLADNGVPGAHGGEALGGEAQAEDLAIGIAFLARHQALVHQHRDHLAHALWLDVKPLGQAR